MISFLVVAFVFFFKQKTAYEMLRSLVGSEMCIRDRSPDSGGQEGKGQSRTLTRSTLGRNKECGVRTNALAVNDVGNQGFAHEPVASQLSALDVHLPQELSGCSIDYQKRR